MDGYTYRDGVRVCILPNTAYHASCPTNLACIALQSSKSPSDPSIANVDDEFVVMLSLIVHRDRAATLATLMKDLINTIADLVACRLSSLETVMLRPT